MNPAPGRKGWRELAAKHGAVNGAGFLPDSPRDARLEPAPLVDRAAPTPIFPGMSKPGVAAVLSFLIPGVGQFYNGKFLRGLFWLIVTPGLWLGTGGFFGWVCHLAAAYTAYAWAKDHP